MTTVFIGGSRQVSRLSTQIRERLDTIIEKRHSVVVGDANGADKAVQKHLADADYNAVTVYCSGDKPRNRLHDWPVENVTPAKGVKGFQFYAAKDRKMAADADFGLMIWDGKSPGTVLNVLRLVQAGKIAVLANVPEGAALNIKSPEHWRDFLAGCSVAFREDLRARATPEEWALSAPVTQLGFSLEDENFVVAGETALPAIDKNPAEVINAALAAGDFATFVDTLGNVARAHGMSQVARDTGLSRESLYRSLGSGGNPEFATIMKVMSSLGLQLEAGPAQSR